jgi:glycerophosphoryl diester phosphodiesterase
VLVAHRGGNTRTALRAALAAGVDWLEVDVWWHYGRVVARHDAAVWRLPVTYSRRRIGLMPLQPVTLDELLDAIEGSPARLLLDLKGSAAALPVALAEGLHRRGALGRTALCGQQWAPLDAARQTEPGVEVFFSLGREEHYPAYLRRLEAGTAPARISIRHNLVTPERVAELHRRGVTLFSWTVNDPVRAHEMVGWGVDGIISDSLALLAGLRHPPAPPRPLSP